MQKQILAIHDISCIGRCSLTVALPVISSMGVETSVLPTAVLSTHTGGFTDYTFRDLTVDLLPIVKHWQTLDVAFDGIYTGYLGSLEQVDIMKHIIDEVKNEDTLVFIDPVMGDHGQLYTHFNAEFVEKMKGLVQKANILIPNMTEACLLLNRPYKEQPYTEAEITEIVYGLVDLGIETVCLTGVQFNEDEIGAAVYQKATNEISYVLTKKIRGDYHGTGDLFASILSGAVTSGVPLIDATRLAVDYTMKSIERTSEAGTDVRFGVQFEPFLSELGAKVLHK